LLSPGAVLLQLGRQLTMRERGHREQKDVEL
jgi:hypothetical protein